MEKWALMEVMRNHEGIFENVSDKIWEFAEIRYHEFQSADLLCQTLKEAGFQVTRPIAGIETAFVGEFGSGKPVIGFLGEFDALPNLSQKANLTRREAIKEDACGHGCGHNLLGVGSLEAACAVKKMIEAGRFHGTVRYYGCPAEESGAGKGFMVRAGVFHDVDICLTWHPTDQNGVMQNALANMRMFFEFHGISAHAGAKPYMGRSALDAVELTNVKGHVCYENVSFHYSDDETEVLSHVSIDIPAGKSVALVGPSGGGKTTICSLLPRFYDVTSGKITVDVHDVRSLTLKSLRSQIGVV